LPDYPRGNEVTIHHLLSHTSGIRSYTSKPEFTNQVVAKITTQELINSFKNDPFDFDPGEKWQYNNSGYFLLGYLIEKISGQTYHDYLKERFFDPLGMAHTGARTTPETLEKAAIGYAFQQPESYTDTSKVEPSAVWNMQWAGGAGILYSTVDDLSKWTQALFSGQVLSERSLQAALSPVVTEEDRAAGLEKKHEGYGYGLGISNYRGLKIVEHGGGLAGFASYLAHYPDKDFTVVVLGNTSPSAPESQPATLARRIAGAFLWQDLKPREVPEVDTSIDSSKYSDYLGRYDYLSAVLTVTRGEDQLYAQLTGQQKFEIYPAGGDEFFWKVAEARVKFLRDDKGEVTKAIHFQNGQSLHVKKLAEIKIAEIDADTLRSYAGLYDYGLGGKLTVTEDKGRLFAQMTGQAKHQIFPESKTSFVWKIVNARIVFLKDEDGQVVKAKHTQGGTSFEVKKIE